MQHQRIFFIRVVSLLQFQPSCQPIFPQLSHGLALYGLRVGTVAPLLTYLPRPFFFVLFTLFVASTYFATYSQHDTEVEKTYYTIGVKYSQQLCSQVIIHVGGNLHFLPRFECREAQVRARTAAKSISEEAASAAAGGSARINLNPPHSMLLSIRAFDSRCHLCSLSTCSTDFARI